jgi:hypothetical protein
MLFLIRRLAFLLRWSFKYLLVGYLLILLVSHLAGIVIGAYERSIQPVCSIPWISGKLPFCPFSGRDIPPQVDVTKASETQKHLDIVMNSAGRGLGISMKMMASEYAVRDLAIRVEYSGLKCKEELGKELDTCVRRASKMSEYVSTALPSTLTD